MARKKNAIPVLGNRVVSAYVSPMPCKLTDTELRERGQSLARVEGDLREHTKHATSVKKELASKEAALEAELARLGNIIRNAAEPRDTEVQVEQISRNRVAVIRLDTHEVLEERPLRDEEAQDELPLVPPKKGDPDVN